MRRALLALLFVSASAHAQTVCRSYEFAELKDMMREQLAAMYCDYRRSMSESLSRSVAEQREGSARVSQNQLDAAARCGQELRRIERILESKPACK